MGDLIEVITLDSNDPWRTVTRVVTVDGTDPLSFRNDVPLDDLGILLDNVSVSAVPVPAAVWLFGSALAGLGWMRRK